MHKYVAGVRVVEAVQHVHESGLPGAVFAKQRMDLTTPQLEVDPGVGHHARKPLHNTMHFDDILAIPADVGTANSTRDYRGCRLGQVAFSLMPQWE
jgi:hypothetical protein